MSKSNTFTFFFITDIISYCMSLSTDKDSHTNLCFHLNFDLELAFSVLIGSWHLLLNATQNCFTACTPGRDKHTEYLIPPARHFPFYISNRIHHCILTQTQIQAYHSCSVLAMLGNSLGPRSRPILQSTSTCWFLWSSFPWIMSL